MKIILTTDCPVWNQSYAHWEKDCLEMLSAHGKVHPEMHSKALNRGSHAFSSTCSPTEHKPKATPCPEPLSVFRYLLQVAYCQALSLTPYKRLHSSEISVLLTDDPVMRTLNASYLHEDKPTNVLAFPLWTSYESLHISDAPLLLGDIVLSWSTIYAESKERQRLFVDHLMHLAIHGFLHLVFYDHDTKEKEQIMQKMESDTLAFFGISNPYERSF